MELGREPAAVGSNALCAPLAGKKKCWVAGWEGAHPMWTAAFARGAGAGAGAGYRALGLWAMGYGRWAAGSGCGEARCAVGRGRYGYIGGT